MKKIQITDLTLCDTQSDTEVCLGFKEKIAIAKQLDRMNVDCIDFGKINNPKTDPLLIETVAPLLKHSAISLTIGLEQTENEIVCKAVAAAKNPRLKLSVPVSTVGMEYLSHKKPSVMTELAGNVIRDCAEKVPYIEFCAEDASRAEHDFLISIIKTAIDAGASQITLCDSACAMLPSETSRFISDIINEIPEIKDKCLTYVCPDRIHMAVAGSFAAVEAGACGIKTCASGDKYASLLAVSEFLRSRGDSMGITSSLDCTVVSTSIKNINHTIKYKTDIFAEKSENSEAVDESNISLDKSDDITSVSSAVKKLGYDLSPEDEAKVFEAFVRVAEKKKVNARELEAIVATSAMQVPSTYRLVSFLTNSGNVISASAHICLEKDGVKCEGITVGDGPIDASFMAIEQIVGHHYELDDFQIQSVTEGHEAMGNALVRLRSGGKIYSGNGISTDIIGASIHAYLNALNKIIYEEAEK